MHALDLSSIGWDDARRSTEHELPAGSVPGRVAIEQRAAIQVLTASGPFTAIVPGRLRRASADICVGDWVAVTINGDGPSVIEAVLPRTSRFTRGAAGNTSAIQTVAANIDIAFVVAGLDAGVNERRLERYTTIAWDGGSTPVILLNKADLSDDVAADRERVEAVAPAVDVHLITAVTGEGVEEIREHVGWGITAAFLGPSGVGKSTLINALLGEARMATGDTREDAKGRHTTTHRELIPLEDGGALIDTPGMREIGLAESTGGIEQSFSDVAELATGCRFSDCTHTSEPGCAVTEAMETGVLDRPRLEAYRKLQRELRFIEAKKDRRLAAEETRRWKAITREMRRRAR